MKFNQLYEFIMSEDANRDFWPPVHDDFDADEIALDPGVAADPEIESDEEKDEYHYTYLL